MCLSIEYEQKLMFIDKVIPLAIHSGMTELSFSGTRAAGREKSGQREDQDAERGS